MSVEFDLLYEQLYQYWHKKSEPLRIKADNYELGKICKRGHVGYYIVKQTSKRTYIVCTECTRLLARRWYHRKVGNDPQEDL